MGGLLHGLQVSAALSERKAQAQNNLVLGERCGVETRKKIICADFSVARDNRCPCSQDARRPTGAGVMKRDRAADCAAVSHLLIRDVAGQGAKHGEHRSHCWVGGYLVVRDHGPNPQLAVHLTDLAQFFEMAQVQQVRRAGQSEFGRGQEALSACKKPCIGLTPEPGARLVDGARAKIREPGHHGVLPFLE